MFVLVFIFVVIGNVAPATDIKKGYCRLDPHPSVEYQCRAPDSEWYRPCTSSEPPDTVVNPRCKKPHYRSTSSLTFMRCLDGEWDYIARCSPECGRVTPNGTELVIGGESVMKGELPWHAGIYKKTRSPYKQICGGSLISTDVVISAAHCFWSDVEKQLPAFQFAVAVGKIYKHWNNNLDEAQKSNVKVIHLPPRYQGAAASHQEDIAVLIVAQEFKYKTYIRPVCLNFDYNFERQQLQTGNVGKVAGWGLVSSSGKKTQILQVVDLPYVEVGTCITKSPVNFREFITGDKICAGSLDASTALCKGDSGGGLAFSDAYHGVERFYLRGVVSAAPSGDDLCTAEGYTAFTSVLKHEYFIKQFWTESGQFKCRDGTFITAANHCDGVSNCPDGSDETKAACSRKTCSSYLFQCAYGACVDKGAKCNRVDECADGSDESVELCGEYKQKANRTTLQTGNRCVLPPYPEHGTYQVTNIAGAKPGEVYDLVTINVTCTLGFHVVGAASIFCFLGKWQESLPDCTNEFRSDYTYYSEVDGWFKEHPVPVNWKTAGLICHYEGADLASPRKPEIAQVLKELVAKAMPKLQVYYSGVRRPFLDPDNFFKELPVDKLSSTWDEDQTSTGQCLVYSSDVVEREFNCEDPLPYICFKRFSIKDQLTDCGTVDKAYKLDGQHCYKLHTRPQTWLNAQTVCRSEGGYLAVVNSETEAETMDRMVNNTDALKMDDGDDPGVFVAIGFREWGMTGSWWTIDGQTLEEAGFEEWYRDSPRIRDTNTSQACGSLFNGKLRDISCNEKEVPFICEKTTDSLTKPITVI